MSLTKTALNTIMAGAFAVTLAGAANAPSAHAMEAGKEKCYGVVKAGKNACANAAGTHSCAGYAETDGDGGEWIALPKGVCDKLVGGSTTPFEGKGYEKAAMDKKEG